MRDRLAEAFWGKAQAKWHGHLAQHAPAFKNHGLEAHATALCSLSPTPRGYRLYTRRRLRLRWS